MCVYVRAIANERPLILILIFLFLFVNKSNYYLISAMI